MASPPVKVPAVGWNLQVTETPKRNKKRKNTSFMKCRLGDNHFTILEWNHTDAGFSLQTMEVLKRIAKVYKNHMLDGLPIPEDELLITVDGNAEFMASYWEGKSKVKSRIFITRVRRQNVDPNAYKANDGLDLEWGLEYQPIEAKKDQVTNELVDAQKKKAEQEAATMADQLRVQVQYQAGMLEKLEAQLSEAAKDKEKGKGRQRSDSLSDLLGNKNGESSSYTQSSVMHDDDYNMSEDDELFAESAHRQGDNPKSSSTSRRNSVSKNSRKRGADGEVDEGAEVTVGKPKKKKQSRSKTDESLKQTQSGIESSSSGSASTSNEKSS
ncbi:hypothetical protein BGZ47_010775, partial [Haplosporangium gracile]